MTQQGRHAALPPPGWAGTQRRIAAQPLIVRFISGDGTESQVFDFGRLNCSDALRLRFADAFEKATGSGGTRRTRASAGALHGTIGVFVASLNTASPVPTAPDDIKRSHIDAFALAQPPKSGRNHLSNLRLLARKGAFAPEAREAVLSLALPPDPRQVQRSYDDGLVRRIERAARSDVRAAYRRIETSRTLADRFEQHSLEANDDVHLAAALAHARRSPLDVPEQLCEATDLSQADLVAHLHLTRNEVTAFVVLLVAQTGANASTVTKWPALHFRADSISDDEPAVAIVRSNKPRRGRRSRFNRVLIDLPEFTADVDLPDGDTTPTFRTGAETYLQLVRLTADTREVTGRPAALQCFEARTQRFDEGYAVGAWAKRHGFKVGEGRGNFADSEVNLRRLRRHAIERTHRPNDNSEATTRREYLGRSERTIEDGFSVVLGALEEQERKARERPMTVIPNTPATLEEAAGVLGTDTDHAQAILSGQQDTVANACVDFRNSPYNAPGEPCGASFLTCLDCTNARALPQHLPTQLALLDGLRDLRGTTPLDLWVTRFAARVAQLEDIVANYSQAEVDRARTAITDRTRDRVTRLLQRHLELP